MSEKREYGYINEKKHERVITALKKEAIARGEDGASFVPKEEDIKRLYLKYGGLYIEKPTRVGRPPKDETTE